MPEIVLSPVVSTLLAQKEFERNKLVEFAQAAFAEAIAAVCKDAGVPEGAQFTLGPTEDGLVKLSFTVPETVPTESEGAE